ncbi:hypothetical protein GGF43_005463 [Coemansia sp. RSA 2618]|nr:hypothetical protein GGF43_005463 [Coemansia sp. RSA 2618]
MPKKTLTVGLPALLNLKAELERAQSESRQDTGGGGSSAKKRKALSGRDTESSNKGVLVRAKKDMLALKSEEPSHKQTSALAKQALEEKSQIYDMLSGSASTLGVELDGSQLEKILNESSVDFVRRRQLLQAASKPPNGGTIDDGSGSDGSIVEIIDEFGRSRVVPRSKAREYCGYSTGGTDSDSESGSSADSRTKADSACRNRSAGYYHLSANYAEREEQLSKLHSLHSETSELRQAAATSMAEMQAQQREQRRTQLRSSIRNSVHK